MDWEERGFIEVIVFDPAPQLDLVRHIKVKGERTN